MRPVSDRWQAAIAASHQVTHLVQVWRDGQLLVDDLPVSGGTVTLDRGAQVTGAATLQVADPQLLPRIPGDALMPLGSELRIHAGIRYPEGAIEQVHIFTGPIVSTSTTVDAGSFTVKAESWLRFVADDRLLAPWSPSGSTVAAIRALLAESAPTNNITIGDVADRPVSGGLVFEEDRLQAVIDLAGSLDAAVVDTPEGFLIAPDPAPDPDGTIVREFVHGASSTMLSRQDGEVTRDERYNAVVAVNPDDPTVRAVATITDPTSPVVWGGPFGRKPLFHSSPLLTAATVQQAAATRLGNLRGRVRRIDAHISPDPALEPGDLVRIVWPPSPGRPTVTEIAQIRAVEHPIGGGVTKLQLRGTA